MTELNEHLIEQQGIDDEGRQKIMALHSERENMFAMMEAQDPTTEQGRTSLGEWAELVEQLEYRLQEAWGFEQNRDMHSWWYYVPHCSCPKMDNRDYMGTDMRIWNGDCPIHGEHTWAKELIEAEDPSLWSRFKNVMYALRPRHPREI